MKNGQPILEVKDLKLHFPIERGFLIKKKTGAIRAIDGINFSLNEGETLGVVGESGCGKSTTARVICQLYQPTKGKVYYKGRDIAGFSQRETMKMRQEIQMVFQDPYASLNPRMTASSIISEPLNIFNRAGILNLSKLDIDKRVDELMETVGLSRFFKNRYPHEFSGGQKQRIGIARALALKPKIILADEPVSALDVSIQSQILNLFKDLQEEFDLTYLFIAHDLSVIEYISNRIVVMYLGKIVEVADADTLNVDPRHPYAEALISAAPIPSPKIERNRKRILLEGDVPSPDRKQSGCYFYNRCPKKMERCKDTLPELKKLDNGSEVACFLYD